MCPVCPDFWAVLAPCSLGGRMLGPGRVGAGNGVTLCDLGVFVDQAAEPVPAQNARTSRFGRRMRASGGRLLLQ